MADQATITEELSVGTISNFPDYDAIRAEKATASYPAIREKLEARFPEEFHSVRDGFTYLDPKCYRDRLNDVFTEGYEFEIEVTAFRPEGIYGKAEFKATLSGVIYKRKVMFAEPWMFAKDSKDIIKADVKAQMANSAGLKAIGRELGIGLYLYDKQSGKSSSVTSSAAQPQAARASAPAASSGSAPAETDVWKFGGKHKDKRVSDIDDGYFEWLSGPDKTGAGSDAARAILSRRATANASQTFDSVVADNATTDDGFFPDEVPF